MEVGEKKGLMHLLVGYSGELLGIDFYLSLLTNMKGHSRQFSVGTLNTSRPKTNEGVGLYESACAISWLLLT